MKKILHTGKLEDINAKNNFYNLKNFNNVINNQFFYLEPLTIDGTENNNHKKQFCQWYEHYNNVHIEYNWSKSRYEKKFEITLRGKKEEIENIEKIIKNAEKEYFAQKIFLKIS